MTDPPQLTFTLSEVVKIASPMFLLLAGIIGGLLKTMVKKQEEALEAAQEDVAVLREKTRESLDHIREDCRRCQAERAKDYSHCIDTFGKLGARIAHVEGANKQ